MENKPYSFSKDKVLTLFNTQASGLTDEEAAERLTKYGPNKLTAREKISPLSLYFAQYKNTLTLILIVAAFLILFIYFFGEHEQSDLIEAGLIFAIVIMITVLGFFQEFKAEKAIESLKKLLAFSAKVRRLGIEKEVDVSELVPGDIVILEEGLKVPADMRLLQVFSLSVNEASLTGESTPVNKKVAEITGDKQIADQKNMVFSGTAIASGRGVGVVVATGDSTEFGKIARDVAETVEDATPIQKRLNEIGKLIGYIILGICAIVFVFIMFFAQEFVHQPLLQRIIHSFIAAVALAVAAIPEGLPAVVTISLALGTQRMLKKNALVRKLSSVETLGSTDIICSDKTGTLTKGEMTVKKIYFDNKLYNVSGTGYETTGEFSIDGNNLEKVPFDNLLDCGFICNNATISTDGKVLGDPTEAALIVSAKKDGREKTQHERITELPFSSERKRMSVVIKQKDSCVLYMKGAPEIVLQKCTSQYKNGREAMLKQKDRDNILKVNAELSTQALRNLGFAYKTMSAKDYEEQIRDEAKLENGLIFLGIQGMIDPPRIEVKQLIDECSKSGIRVVMITGDHVATAQAVAREIGIADNTLTGDDLDKMSDEDFVNKVESISIYARVNPGAKMRIVEALKKKGHIVAMTGDGVNDAPALKKADIGIAMGISGTDVAKEASDMILLDDKFSTIIAAIEEGRGIFHNIRKFVVYLLSCNIAEVIVVFVGVLFFHKLPLSAMMLLWINVVTDGIPAVALGLDTAERGIMRYSPKVFQAQIISKRLWIEMIIFGILLAIQILAIYMLNLHSGEQAAQGAAFSAIVVFELINLYIVRSAYKVSFFSNKWLFISIFVTIGLQLLIVYTPNLAQLFEIKPVELSTWFYIITASAWLWFAFSVIRIFLKRIESAEKSK